MAILTKIVSNIRNNKAFWVFFWISTIIFTMWWVAFFPAIMTGDSFTQWTEASAFKFFNWHPYLSTLSILLLRKIYDSPTIIVITQLLATSAIFSYIFSYFLKKGVNKYLIGILFTIFATSIPIGIYNITLWKDIPFSLGLVFLSFLVSKSFLEKKLSNIPLLLILLTIACFFRHNGLVNVGIVPIIFLIYLRRMDYRKVYLFISLFTSIVILVVFVLPTLLKVTPMPSWFTSAAIYYETVSYLEPLPAFPSVKRVTPLTLTTLEKVMPISDLLKSYDPRASELLIFNKKINQEQINNSSIWSTIRNEFWSYNLPANFDFFVGHRVQMLLTNTLGYGSTAATGIVDNPLGFVAKSPAPFIKNLFTKIVNISTATHTIRLLIWNSLLGILFLIFVAIDSIYRKKHASLIFALIILSNTFALALLNITSDWRYYYFAYLAMFVIIPLFALDSKKNAS